MINSQTPNLTTSEGVITLNPIHTILTSGDSLWSKNPPQNVGIKKIQWYESKWEDEEEPGKFIEETKVLFFFDKSWKVSEDGLIYTDKLFLEGAQKLIEQLVEEGKCPKWKEELSYAEQGMQGEKYVMTVVGSW
jgi:hypothetical protein